MLTDEEVRALRLIDCGKNTRFTEYANVLVSREVKSLLDSGLIQYAPERWSGYKLTRKGRAVAKS